MSRKPIRHQAVRDPEQIARLESPVRQDIVDTLEALGGEADIATVADQMGRAADGLYYHFDVMTRAGLLRRVDTGGARRYRIGTKNGATKLLLHYGEGEAGRAAIGRVVDRALQTARRDFHAALADAAVTAEGPQRQLWAGRTQGWVDRTALAQINRHLAAIQALLHGPRRAGHDRLVSVSFVLAPVRRRARRGERE